MVRLSTLSITPPIPGNNLLLSLTPESRLMALMLMSPKKPAIEMRIAITIGPTIGRKDSDNASGPDTCPKDVSHGAINGANTTMTNMPPKNPSQVLFGEITGEIRCLLWRPNIRPTTA